MTIHSTKRMNMLICTFGEKSSASPRCFEKLLGFFNFDLFLKYKFLSEKMSMSKIGEFLLCTTNVDHGEEKTNNCKYNIFTANLRIYHYFISIYFCLIRYIMYIFLFLIKFYLGL